MPGLKSTKTWMKEGSSKTLFIRQTDRGGGVEEQKDTGKETTFFQTPEGVHACTMFVHLSRICQIVTKLDRERWMTCGKP